MQTISLRYYIVRGGRFKLELQIKLKFKLEREGTDAIAFRESCAPP